MAEDSSFSLSPQNAGHVLTLQEAAESCGVSRQAFHGWGVKPERVQGTVKLFTMAAILDNRLRAARQAQSPAETDRDRLEARRSLLLANVERERVLLAQAHERYAPVEFAQRAVSDALALAVEVLERLPTALLESHPKIAGAQALIQRDVQRAIEPLRSRIDDAEFEPPADSSAEPG